MAAKGILNRLTRSFEDQFESTGSGYIYRKSQRGEPLRVSDSERGALVASYVRGLRVLFFVLFLFLITIGPVAALYLPADEPWIVPLIPIAVPVGGIAIVLIVNAWLWGRPARQLQRRGTRTL